MPKGGSVFAGLENYFVQRENTHGPAERGLNQIREDGCQLRSGRGSRANTSSENRSNAGHWPTSSLSDARTPSLGAEGPKAATLKVGRGLGTESPGGGLGAEAAKPPEPPSLLDTLKHKCNTGPPTNWRPPEPAVHLGLTREERDRALSQETRRARRGRYCGQWTTVGSVDGKFVYGRFRCKSYSCPRCGPAKGRRVKKRIAELATQHKLQRLVTLTLDPKKLGSGWTQEKKVRYLRERWRRMGIYLKRKLGRSAVFISVLEFQKNGNPHLHVLVDSYLPHEWLLKSWQALGGGYTDIRFVDLHRVAAYLSKYLTKQWLEDFPVDCRRVTASRGLVFFERTTAKGDWVLFRRELEWFVQRAETRGIAIEEADHIEQDGVLQLVRFIASEFIRWIEPVFEHSNRWREARFPRSTSRRAVPPHLRYSPVTRELVLVPESIQNLGSGV